MRARESSVSRQRLRSLGSDFSQTATGIPKPCFFFLIISMGSRLPKAFLKRYRFSKPFTLRCAGILPENSATARSRNGNRTFMPASSAMQVTLGRSLSPRCDFHVGVEQFDPRDRVPGQLRNSGVERPGWNRPPAPSESQARICPCGLCVDRNWCESSRSMPVIFARRTYRLARPNNPLSVEVAFKSRFDDAASKNRRHRLVYAVNFVGGIALIAAEQLVATIAGKQSLSRRFALPGERRNKSGSLKNSRRAHRNTGPCPVMPQSSPEPPLDR